MGLPVVVMEFAMGRASQKSITKSYDVLEPKGTKWHIHKYFAFGGNYLLMMFYTTVGGWMLAYFVKMLKGDFVGADSAQIAQTFSDLTSNRNEMIFWMVLISVLGLLVCSLGLEKGVEKITKPMMLCLFGILLVLIVRAVTLPNAAEGLSFYLKPDISKVKEAGLGQVLFAAMGQSFFTLSIGIGSLSIFGSYLGKERSLTGEAVNVMVLDTAVAIMSGLIIFPACFAFGINPGEGPGLVFVTLPNVFNAMAGGRFWGTLFFLFMTFAAFSTVIAVFQNIIACARDLWGWSLKKSILINGGLLIVLSLPCILGMTDWLPACGQILGTQANGSIRDIQWLEDFIVSNNLLPLGAVVYLLFCTTRYGWGWKNFVEEANTGTGMKFRTAKAYRIYLTFILPVVILYITAQAYLTLFK
jgi:NSS family neurotransmitter:Na+ symporter